MGCSPQLESGCFAGCLLEEKVLVAIRVCVVFPGPAGYQCYPGSSCYPGYPGSSCYLAVARVFAAVPVIVVVEVVVGHRIVVAVGRVAGVVPAEKGLVAVVVASLLVMC